MKLLQRVGRHAAPLAVAFALVGVAAPAATADGAFVTHENVSGTATFPIDNPCNGETFLATSTFQFTTTIWSTSSGVSGKADIGVFHGSGDTADGAHYVFTTVGTLVPIVFEAGPPHARSSSASTRRSTSSGRAGTAPAKTSSSTWS